MMNGVIFSLWFFLPAGLANIVPVFASRIYILRNWSTPIDFGKQYKGQDVLGKNKTWRGLICGILIGMLVCYLQRYFFNNFSWINSFCLQAGVDYSSLNVFLLGGLLGFGALVGDGVESFFKRLLVIKPGHKWIPFDQIDYIVGGLLASSLVIILNIPQYLLIFVVWFLMHLLFSYIGYLLKLKDRPI